MVRWHCPPDTGFEIRALAVWGRARYLSVTEALHNTEFYTWVGKKYFCFFQTAETGNWTSNSGVKGSGANHYPKAPAHKKIFSYSDISHAKSLNLHPLEHFTFQALNSSSTRTFHIPGLQTFSYSDISHLRPLNLLLLGYFIFQAFKPSPTRTFPILGL